jgi:Cdc6-like AAA superfamily ATPase
MSYVSASASTKDGMMKVMLKHAAKKFGLEKPSIESLEKQAKKNVLILIIDEVDVLVKNSDGERFFHELVRLANEEHLRFSLIGISNSVNDEFSVRIKEIAAVSIRVFF